MANYLVELVVELVLRQVLRRDGHRRERPAAGRPRRPGGNRRGLRRGGQGVPGVIDAACGGEAILPWGRDFALNTEGGVRVSNYSAPSSDWGQEGANAA